MHNYYTVSATARYGAGRKSIAVWYWNVTVANERRARNVLGCRHNNFFPNVSLKFVRCSYASLPSPTTPTNYTVWYSPEPWPYWCRRGKSRRNGIGLVSSSGGANLLKKKKHTTTRTYYIQAFDDGVGFWGLVTNVKVGKMWRFHRWWRGHDRKNWSGLQLSVPEMFVYSE